MSIRSLTETFIKYFYTKTGILLFFVLLFFIIFGFFSFTKMFAERIVPFYIPILSKQQGTKIPEEPAVDYQSKKISIATPFGTTISINEPIFPDHICSITDYGAIADEKTLNTEAFRKAIDACSALGGGKIIVPAGIWLTGPIHLKSNIELHVEREATILFSTRSDDYLPVVFSRFEGIEYYNYSPPIYAENCTNIAITGVGTIDGQGPTWWWKLQSIATHSINKLYAMGDDNTPLNKRVFGTEEAGLRPSFIEFVHCNNVLIEDVKIKNGPMWTIHPIYSSDIIVRGVDIATDPGPSTDGVAVDSTSNVLIENATLATGDDAIVLKSGRDKEGMRLHIPTENVVIRNCTIKDAHGAIAIGSEVSGDVRNVFASDINIKTVQYGFRIKATKGRGGVVENVWIEDMKISHTTTEAIQITTAYGLPFRAESTALPLVRNIHLKNISATKTSQAININGLPEMPISDISFEDVTLATHIGIGLSNTKNISFSNMDLTLKDNDPLFAVTDSTHINIDAALCKVSTPVCLLLQGGKSNNINVHNSGFDRQRIKVLTGVNPEAIVY